ncbi:MAG: hypothetical protein C4308_02060 [Chitinophagaceae bacterium]
MKTTYAVLLFLIVFFLACKKDSFTTSSDAVVNITADTIKFDTVFTTAGSITQSFKIINKNDQKLRLSSVKLMGGNSSYFKINVDGFTGPRVDNIEINANDSVYVFASVIINPNMTNLPFVVRDSIEVTYNGNTKYVQLEAWGQNAHFFRNKKITVNETWINDLPYVILGSLTIDTNKILTINKGVRIYVHADAPIIVNGTLQVNGQKDTIDRVYFRGDRLDDPYKDFPASWPGIFFRGASKDNVLNYAVLKNAYQAIAAQDPSPNANPKVTLNQCVIDNAYDAGIVTLNSSVTAVNCLVSNCGKNLYLLKGGDYNFTHCTIASYSNNFILHRDPVLLVSNYININNTPVTANLNGVFRNCIFWGENGTVDDEVVVAKSGSTVFNVNFDHNLWKVQNTPPNITATQIISNQPPEFDSINVAKNYYDFRLKASSPAINKGVTTTTVIDLDGKPRAVGLPDLGAFEKQ